jgi:hypothetical protein
LLQVFLLVLLVIVFAGINIVVRLITDPLCIKVLRMREDKRWPSLIGLVISTVIMVILLIVAYTSFPQLRPTVIGWAGKHLQQVVTWDRLPDIEMPAGLEPVPKGDVPPTKKPPTKGKPGGKPAETEPAGPAKGPPPGSSPPAKSP